MNKRRIFQWVAIVLVLVLVFGVVWLLLMKDAQNKPQDNLEPSQTQGSQNDTEKEETTTPTKPSAPTNYISFPYHISGTPLVIEQVNSYDGIFFEDGSDREMSNVTAIVLKNTGDECVNYLDISIERDGTQLRFAGSALGPGDTAIVLEANAKQFGTGKYSNCEAEIATEKEMEMSQDQVRVEDTAENDLLVTNITGKDIACIRVFYKFYMYETDVYVGGITYSAKLVDLAAGDSFVIRPSHYIRGYSKVVMVKTYDSDE